jgi:hypothetical protein
MTIGFIFLLRQELHHVETLLTRRVVSHSFLDFKFTVYDQVDVGALLSFSVYLLVPFEFLFLKVVAELSHRVLSPLTEEGYGLKKLNVQI